MEQVEALRKCEGHDLDLMVELDHTKLVSLRKHFDELGGSLKKGDFVRVIKAHLTHNNERSELETVRSILMIFRVIDINDNGDVDWKEFQKYLQKSGMFNIGSLRQVETDFSYTPSTTVKDRHRRKLPIDRLWYFEELDKLAIVEKNASVVKLYNWNCEGDEKCISMDSVILNAAYASGRGYLGVSTIDKKLRIWDCTASSLHSAYMCRHEFRVEHPQTALGYNSSKRLMFSGGLDGTLNVFDLDEWQRVEATVKAHSDYVSDIVDLPGLRDSLATSSLDSFVKIWDTMSVTCVKTLTGHRKGVTTLSQAPHLQLLVSGGYDHEVFIWNPYVQNLVGKLRGHAAEIIDVQCIPDTYQVLTSDLDGLIKLWDMRNYQCLDTLVASTTSSTDEEVAHMAATTGTLGIAGDDGRGSISGVSQGAIIDKNVKGVAFMNNHKRFVAGGRKLYFFDGSVQKNAAMTTADTVIQSCHYNDLTGEILTVYGRKVKLWDANLGFSQKIFRNLNIQDDITAFCFTSDKRKFVVGTNSGEIKVYNSGTGTSVETLTGRKGKEISRIMYHQQSKTVLVIFKEGIGQVHQCGTLPTKGDSNLLRYFRCPPVASADLSSLASLIVVAGEDNKLRFYDYEACTTPDATLQASNSPITCVRFLQDLPLVAVAEVSGKISLWSTRPLAYKNEKLITVKLRSPLEIDNEAKRKEQRAEYMKEMQAQEDKANRDQANYMKALGKSHTQDEGETLRLSLKEDKGLEISNLTVAVSSQLLDIPGGATQVMTHRTSVTQTPRDPPSHDRKVKFIERPTEEKPGQTPKPGYQPSASRGAQWEKKLEGMKDRQMRRRSSVALLEATLTHTNEETHTRDPTEYTETSDNLTTFTEGDWSEDDDEDLASQMMANSTIESLVFVRSSRVIYIGDSDGYVTCLDISNTLHKLNILLKPSTKKISSRRRGARPNVPELNLPSSMRDQDRVRKMSQPQSRPKLHVRDISQGSHWRAHKDILNSMQFVEEPPCLLTASFDRTAKMWKLDGTPLGTLCVENEQHPEQWKFETSFYSTKKTIDSAKVAMVMKRNKIMDENQSKLPVIPLKQRIKRKPPKLEGQSSFFGRLKTVQNLTHFPVLSKESKSHKDRGRNNKEKEALSSLMQLSKQPSSLPKELIEDEAELAAVVPGIEEWWTLLFTKKRIPKVLGALDERRHPKTESAPARLCSKLNRSQQSAAEKLNKAFESNAYEPGEFSLAGKSFDVVASECDSNNGAELRY